MSVAGESWGGTGGVGSGLSSGGGPGNATTLPGVREAVSARAGGLWSLDWLMVWKRSSWSEASSQRGGALRRRGRQIRL